MTDTNIYIILAIGLWGGLVNYHNINKKDTVTLFSSIIISTGLSLITLLALNGYKIDHELSIAISGIVAYKGASSFYLLELILTEKFGARDTYEMLKRERRERREIK